MTAVDREEVIRFIEESFKDTPQPSDAELFPQRLDRDPETMDWRREFGDLTWQELAERMRHLSVCDLNGIGHALWLLTGPALHYLMPAMLCVGTIDDELDTEFFPEFLNVIAPAPFGKPRLDGHLAAVMTPAQTCAVARTLEYIIERGTDWEEPREQLTHWRRLCDEDARRAD